MKQLMWGGFFQIRSEDSAKGRIEDYVFLCFFLGNDFLPHYPYINLRTNGMCVLMDIYRKTILKGELLIKDEKLDWSNILKIIERLGNMEEELMLREHIERENNEKIKYRERTAKELREKVLRIPLIYREEEKYVNPRLKGWRKRYYKGLWLELGEEGIDEVAMNALEGLEWVYRYYKYGENSEWWSLSKTGILMSDIYKKKDEWLARVAKGDTIRPTTKKEYKTEKGYKKYLWEIEIH